MENVKTVVVSCLILLGLGCVQQQADPFAGKIIDLTYSFDENTIFWPTAESFELVEIFKGTTDAGYHYEANNFFSAEHGGTHLDAPIHFAAGAHSTDEIPLERLISKAGLIDVVQKCADNPDYLVQVEDFTAWEQKHGQRVDGLIILLRTGYGKFWPDRTRYMGTDQRGQEAVANLHFPGLAPDAAKWLVENRSIKAIGLDTPSIDYGQSTTFESHVTLYSKNIPAFENVANLDQLPETDFTVIALPMKIKGGSGGPLRIVALVNQTTEGTPKR